MNLKFTSSPYVIIYAVKIINKDEVKKIFNCNIPYELIDFWNTYSHICFEFGVSIYGYEDVIERSILYELPKYLPEYIMIGDDGGGRGIFLKKGDSEMYVYYLDLGALGSLPLDTTNSMFLYWLENGAIIE